MLEPSVSVAMCTFNGASFVEEQVRSILNQTTQVRQLVVADDGSLDSTLEIVRRTVAESGSGVDLVILDEPLRKGVTANFERAILASDGEIIILCDQDDVWHPDRVEIGLASLANGRQLFTHTDARLIDSAGAALTYSLFDSLGISSAVRRMMHADGTFPVYLRRNLATGATACFRRELLEVAIPFPPQWLHDEWLAIIAAAQERLLLVDALTIDYRQHSSNQIGVVERKLRTRIRRALAPRGDRTLRLAERSSILSKRLEERGVRADYVQRAGDKARFELERSRLPRHRRSRLIPIAKAFRRGDYSRYASQGNFDIVRDLLQPVTQGPPAR